MKEQSYSECFEAVKETTQAITKLMDKAVEQYTTLVDAVIARHITDEREIERILDGLLDFGADTRCIDIYRKLCRHVFYNYPQMVGEHVALWKLQFMTPNEMEEQT